jgi:hypothetical protein
LEPGQEVVGGYLKPGFGPKQAIKHLRWFRGAPNQTHLLVLVLVRSSYSLASTCDGVRASAHQINIGPV